MKNYNTLNEILKDETVNYKKNITKGLGKVKLYPKINEDVIYGLCLELV